MVDNWSKYILNGLFPRPCALCGDQASQDFGLCDACHADLPVLTEACLVCANPLASAHTRLGLSHHNQLVQIRRCGQCQQQAPAFDDSLVFFPYQPPFDALVQGIKFHGRLAHARLLGELMAQQLVASHDGLEDLPDALLPVPLHRQRLRQRGFNQALELARPVSKALGIPLMAHAVDKYRDTPAQSALDLDQRRRNLRGAFIVQQRFNGEHVAIIDDVMTSGATMNAMAHLLKSHGAGRISAWCCCRAVMSG